MVEVRLDRVRKVYVTHDQIEAMTLGSRIVVPKAAMRVRINKPPAGLWAASTGTARFR